MNIAHIKKLNENMPYWVKRPFAGIIRSRLTKNIDFFNQYKELRQFDDMGVEERKAHQLAKLRELLIYAQEHCPYYRELFVKYSFCPQELTSIADLKVLPLLTKADLQKHFAEIMSDENLDYYEVSTGGTTGKPVKIMMERKAIFREWAFVYHYWSKFGYDYRLSGPERDEEGESPDQEKRHFV